MADRKTVIRNTRIFYIVIIIIVFILLYTGGKFLFAKNPTLLMPTQKLVETYSISEGLNNLISKGGTAGGFSEGGALKYTGIIISSSMRWIFGVDFKEQIADSVIITLIAVWFIFFLVLADFMELFGMMNKTTSKLVAIFITLAMANLGFFYGMLVGLMNIFAFFAGLAVIVALFSIIFFAFAAHLGINSLGVWMMDRKAMLEAAKMEAGGEATAGAIGGLRRIGKALKANVGHS